MNARQIINPAQLFMEIGQDELRAFNGSEALEVPLERLADGHLTEAAKTNITSQLQRFIDHKNWQPRARVFCAVGARGVSLRRLKLPPSSKEELHRLLPLQIESEFPLPPDQLAWGFQSVTPGNALPGLPAMQELLVGAVKKDILEEYSDILSRCGATPIFTLAALARSYICPQPIGSYAVLHLERTYSELITIDNGVPTAVRVLAWGRENLSRLANPLGNGREGNVAPVSSSAQSASFGGNIVPAHEHLAAGALLPLVRLVNGQPLGRLVYVIGLQGVPADLHFTERFAGDLGNGVECHAVTLPAGTTGSAAILGLQRALERDGSRLPLVLQVKQTSGKVSITRQASLKWAAAAVGLGLLALLLPYAEALTLKSHLAHKLASIKTDQGRLTIMDRELDFLQYLKENEPPYLDALLALAKAAPPGTRFDSVSMNRRGDVSLRGSLHDGQQVADLRSKLIDSGFFANVAIEEQTPAPDHQKVTVRMSAQWKPTGSRTTPSVEPGHRSAQPPIFPGPGMAGPPPDGAPGPIARPPVRNVIRN
jgi:hypothetical protein